MRQSPDIRIRLYMEHALERACQSIPHGGDHGLRSFIAQRLKDASEGKQATLGELGIIARKALADYQTEQCAARITQLPGTPTLVRQG